MAHQIDYLHDDIADPYLKLAIHSLSPEAR